MGCSDTNHRGTNSTTGATSTDGNDSSGEDVIEAKDLSFTTGGTSGEEDSSNSDSSTDSNGTDSSDTTGSSGDDIETPQDTTEPDTVAPKPDTIKPEPDAGPNPDGTSAVKAKAIYDVKVTSDVKYGTGVINTWSGKDDTIIDLLLDIYEPVGAKGTKKPTLMIIHGGGFVGGQKDQKQLVMFGEFFAARGFVCFSVDYRVAKDEGLLPGNWPFEAAAIAPEMKVTQFKALYPAGRDVKAAVRWVRENSFKYGLDTDAIAAMGGSAGAFLALMLGTTEEDDYKSEVDFQSDPFLLESYLNNSSKVAAVIDLWGGTALLDAVKFIDGKERFDKTDAPVAIIHGKNDESVPFTEAEEIKAAYEKTGVAFSFHPLDAGHGAWSSKIDGKNLAQVSFEFIAKHLNLIVE